jgi:hypothetical protein
MPFVSVLNPGIPLCSAHSSNAPKAPYQLLLVPVAILKNVLL